MLVNFPFYTFQNVVCDNALCYKMDVTPHCRLLTVDLRRSILCKSPRFPHRGFLFSAECCNTQTKKPPTGNPIGGHMHRCCTNYVQRWKYQNGISSNDGVDPSNVDPGTVGAAWLPPVCFFGALTNVMVLDGSSVRFMMTMVH